MELMEDDEASDSSSTLIPVLKQQGDVVNGLLCVDWQNAFHFDQDEYIDYEYKLLHRYTFGEGKAQYEDYPPNEWLSTDKIPIYFEPDGRFHIKLPLFLQPYRFEFKLKVVIWNVVHCDDDENGNDNDNISDSRGPDLQHHRPENPGLRWQITRETTSEIASTEVPSVLVDHKKSYRNGDVVSWFDSENGTFSEGVITEIGVDTLTVKEDINFFGSVANRQRLNVDDDGKMVVIPTSQVMVEEVANENIIDVTSRGAAELALILRTNNEKSQEIYYALREISRTFVRDFLIPDLMECMFDYEPFRDEIVYSSLLSIQIHEFLFSPQYRLRFDCCIGQSHLYLQPQWSFALSKANTYGYNPVPQDAEDSDSDQEEEQFDLERKIHSVCYHCDLCRMEIHHFEYALHCQCTIKGEHDFCISCIHSIFMQHSEMKPFLTDILKTALNDHCIEEIVAFCIGKVNLFHIEPIDDQKWKNNPEMFLEQKMKELDVS